MKPKKLALIFGLAALGVGSAIVLYKKNLKKIKDTDAENSKDFEELGISDIEKVTQEPINIKDPEYGDLKRFSDLPVPHQIKRLLGCSTNWTDDDLDWEKAVYSDEGSVNSVHVVFKEGREGDYPNNKIGFFIEVPAILDSPKGMRSDLKYKNYLEYLSRLSQEFWADHRIECEKPRSVDCIGLYSKKTTCTNETGTATILEYTKIPEDTLKSRSKYNDRLDGLYCYYSDAKKAFEEGKDILPDGVEDIHLFMGVWFKLGCPATKTYGMTGKQVLKFLEEMVIKDNYVVEDYNHRNRQVLGPVIIHPGSELEFILADDLSVKPIFFG